MTFRSDRSILLVSFLSVLSLLATLNACANEPKAVPKKTETLTARLELRDSQDGFAGSSGILCVVEMDGRFSVARFVNEKIEMPMRSGRLNSGALAELASTLKAQQLQTLPAQIGEPPAVNPRRLGIQYGSTRAQLILNPGEDIGKALAAQEQMPSNPKYRFLVVASTILRLVGHEP